MSPRLPTIEQLLDIANFYGMHLTAEDAASFRGLMAGPIASYARLDQLAEPKLPVKFPREPGYRPGPEENRYNAWYWKTNIKGSGKGVLAGKTVAIKDNIWVRPPSPGGQRMINASTYWITVVETNPFGKRAKELLTDDERESLTECLALSPETGDIIPGTGGVRKLTWQASSQGKRGQVRIIYYFRDLNMPVYLLDICSKGERIDFSASGKRLINQLVDQLVSEYSEQWSRIVKLQRDGA